MTVIHSQWIKTRHYTTVTRYAHGLLNYTVNLKVEGLPCNVEKQAKMPIAAVLTCGLIGDDH